MKLTTNEKIGQLFLVGITKKDNIIDVVRLIKKYNIGGVVIYKNNYDSYDDMIDLINVLKKANEKNRVPLFIGIDQEGGRVNRFPSEFSVLKNAYEISKTSDDNIRESGIITSLMLSGSGINMNFAPVLDLKYFHDEHYIGNRAYSKDVNKIIKVSDIVTDELKRKNIVPVYKHFPGHGSIKRDSHFLLPIVKNYSDILKTDILPFEHVMKNNADAIMVGHIVINGETGLYPASLSKRFIKKIRKDYSYERLIITDELSMRSVRYIYGKSRAINIAINAGVDIVMCKYFSGIENSIISLINKYEFKEINNVQIDNSIERILFVKRKYKVNDKLVFSPVDVENVNKRIKKVNENTKKM